MAIRERIRANFDRAAQGYAGFERKASFFRSLCGELISQIPSVEGASVLDVGCGTGASLEVLSSVVGPEGRVVGLDVSLGMLREARRNGGCRAQVVLGDGCSYGRLFRCVFDVVAYNAVLFMLPDAAASLRSAAEVLREKGSVLISILEGIYVVGSDRRLVVDMLEEKGLAPGRHMVSSWPVTVRAMAEFFEAPCVRSHNVRFTEDDFNAFYGLEPMSAGLLPAVPFPERLGVLRELAREWTTQGLQLEQVWKLASARKLS